MNEKENIYQYQCPSYFDDGGILRDCKCGKCFPKTIPENDDPEITEKDFEDIYISQGKNETEKMERRFKIWLENRDDNFELDTWDFRCLQDFIFAEIKLALPTQDIEENHEV